MAGAAKKKKIHIEFLRALCIWLVMFYILPPQASLYI